MEYINKEGIIEMLDDEQLSTTEMILFEIAIQLEKLV